MNSKLRPSVKWVAAPMKEVMQASLDGHPKRSKTPTTEARTAEGSACTPRRAGRIFVGVRPHPPPTVMVEVICLSDSDNEGPAPPLRSPAPALAPLGSRRRRGDVRDDDGSEEELALPGRRPAKAPRATARAARSVRAARGATPSAAPSAAPSVSDDRERVRAEKAAQRAAAAAEKDRAKARRAAERVAAAEAREREKNARAVERGLAALAGGKLKLKQITAVVGSALAAAPLGRALRDAFDQGVKDDARGVTPLLHTVEDLPVDFPAMTWRSHAPSDEPVGPDGEPRFASESRRAAASAEAIPPPPMHALAYVTGESFANMCVADHGATTTVAGSSPSAGLRAFLRRFRDAFPDHVLGIVIEGLRRHCQLRERREFRSSGAGGFSRVPVETALARLYVAEPDVRVAVVPDLDASLQHVVQWTATLAKRPFAKETTTLDIVGFKAKAGPAAGAALEAAAARWSRGAGIGVDGLGGASLSQGDEDAEQGAGAGAGGRRLKSQGETWASALMKIDGCAEPSALSIVRAFPTMATLMARYRDPSLSEQQKKNLLADLERTTTSTQQQTGRRVGPAVSHRVYAVFRPRDEDDPGDEIVGVAGKN